MADPAVRCAPRLELRALAGLPIVEPGDDVAALISSALAAAGEALAPHDVVVITSKLLSRAEGRFVDVSQVVASDRAVEHARVVGKDPRVIELVLRESSEVSRVVKDALITRHRLGFVCANAGIDLSNAAPRGARGGGPWALLLPEAPDLSAEALRARLEGERGGPLGVVISDSFGRPFRLGTVGVAVGVAGMPALFDQRGRSDLFGKRLEHTITALADQVAAAADLVAGQADEGRPVVIVRGLEFRAGAHSASELLRPAEQDLYA